MRNLLVRLNQKLYTVNDVRIVGNFFLLENELYVYLTANSQWHQKLTRVNILTNSHDFISFTNLILPLKRF